MNSLIANTKPSLPQSKNLQKKLTANASKLLFPIREQKLLLKRSGKEGQFGMFKVTARMEDLTLPRSGSSLLQGPAASSLSQLNDSSLDEKLPKAPEAKAPSQRKSTQTTPSQAKRRESVDDPQQCEAELTPSQPPSRLLQIQQRFWEKYTNSGQPTQCEEGKRPATIASEASLSPPTKRDSRSL